MDLLRGVEVRADAELGPGVAQVARDRAHGAVLAEPVLGLALPVVEDRRAHVGVAAVIRALDAEHHARTTDERVGSVLFDLDAGRGRVVYALNMAVHHLDLWLNEEGVVQRIEAPARFGRHREGVRVVVGRRATHVRDDVELVLDAAVLRGHVKEKTVVPELRAVARERQHGIVATARAEIAAAVGPRKRLRRREPRRRECCGQNVEPSWAPHYCPN